MSGTRVTPYVKSVVPVEERDAGLPLPPVLARMVSETPVALHEVIAAAVDPLEIAAALETCGLSNAVVQDRYGQKDVFSLADQLYAAVELRGAPASNPGTKRHGDFSDLARGLVFAAPALMFAGAALALRSWLTWWSTPLALMWGWAFSQFLAYVSFSRRAWGKPAGSAVAWGILAALVSCCCLGIAGDALLGGNIHGVVFAAGACAFMTAAAELLARQQERLVALMLLPGAIGSVIFVVKEPVHVPPDVVLALATASVAGTVLLALRHLPAHWWREPALSLAEAPSAVRYFLHGLCCGLFVALFMVLEPGTKGARGWPAAAAYPIVLSLGAMEWQLRSLKANARHALLGSHTLAEFTRAARWALARSVLCYIAVLAAMTGVVEALASARAMSVPVPLLTAGAAVAVAFFLGLIVASCGQINLVLRTWAGGLGLYGVWTVAARTVHATGAFGDTRLAFCSAALVSALCLAAVSAHVVVSPVCHG